MKKVLFALIVLSAFNSSVFGGVRVKRETIRSLEVQVIDATTGKPLPNVVVYYELEGVGPKNFLGIPLVDPVYNRNIRRERFKTNQEGKFLIPEQKVWLNLYENISMEWITMNLDITEGDKSDCNKFFVELARLVTQDIGEIFTPLDTYKGFILVNVRGESRLPGEKDRYEKDLYIEKRNRGSLGKDKESIIISMERKAEK